MDSAFRTLNDSIQMLSELSKSQTRLIKALNDHRQADQIVIADLKKRIEKLEGNTGGRKS